MILQTSAGNKFTFEVVEEGIKIVFYDEDSCIGDETVISPQDWELLSRVLDVLKQN